MTLSSRIENIRPGQGLSRTRLERLLEHSTPPPGQAASSLYLRPGQAALPIAPPDAGLSDGPGPASQTWQKVFQKLDPALLKSDTGIIGLQSGQAALVILPPFPVPQDTIVDHWDTGPFLSLLAAEYTVGVVLLRLGRYSVAVYQGEKLLTSKTDARYVKGRHHAGGTSQLRFQRVREGQMRKIYDETCRTVQAQFAPYARDIDYVLLGGENLTLNGFLKVCPYMQQFRDKTLGRRLNIRDPKRDTLEEAAGMLKESRVYPVSLEAHSPA